MTFDHKIADKYISPFSFASNEQFPIKTKNTLKKKKKILKTH